MATISPADLLAADYWDKDNVPEAIMVLHQQPAAVCPGCRSAESVSFWIKDDNRIEYCDRCEQVVVGSPNNEPSAMEFLICAQANIRDYWRKFDNLHTALLIFESKGLLDKIDMNAMLDDAYQIAATVLLWLAEEVGSNTENIDNPVVALAAINRLLVEGEPEKDNRALHDKSARLAETFHFLFRALYLVEDNEPQLELFYTTLAGFAVSAYYNAGNYEKCIARTSSLSDALACLCRGENVIDELSALLITVVHDAAKAAIKAQDVAEISSVLEPLTEFVEKAPKWRRDWRGKLRLCQAQMLNLVGEYQAALTLISDTLQGDLTRREAAMLKQLSSEIEYQQYGKGNGFDGAGEETGLATMINEFDSLVRQVDTGSMSVDADTVCDRFLELVQANVMGLSDPFIAKLINSPDLVLIAARRALSRGQPLPLPIVHELRKLAEGNGRLALEADILASTGLDDAEFMSAFRRMVDRISTIDQYSGVVVGGTLAIGVFCQRCRLVQRLNLALAGEMLSAICHSLYALLADRKSATALLNENRLLTQDTLQLMGLTLFLINLDGKNRQLEDMFKQLAQLVFGQYALIVSKQPKPSTPLIDAVSRAVVDGDDDVALKFSKEQINALVDQDNAEPIDMTKASRQRAIYLVPDSTVKVTAEATVPIAVVEFAADTERDFKVVHWDAAANPISAFFDDENRCLSRESMVEFSRRVFPRCKVLDRQIVEIKAPGYLAQVPFAALNDSKGKRLGLSTTPCLLTHMESVVDFTPYTGGKVVLVGDPVYRSKLQQLNRSGSEVENIATVFADNAQTLLRGQANRYQVAARMMSTDTCIVHFGCHGFAGSIPETAHLALSQFDQRHRECLGALTYTEISLMNLSHVKLVVLAACHSQKGQVSQSEGIFALSHAFKSAGVQSVIAARWAVHDRASEVYWTYFYQQLNQGMLIHEALRSANRMMDEHSKYHDPKYWAGYQLVV